MALRFPTLLLHPSPSNAPLYNIASRSSPSLPSFSTEPSCRCPILACPLNLPLQTLRATAAISSSSAPSPRSPFRHLAAAARRDTGCPSVRPVPIAPIRHHRPSPLARSSLATTTNDHPPAASQTTACPFACSLAPRRSPSAPSSPPSSPPPPPDAPSPARPPACRRPRSPSPTPTSPRTRWCVRSCLPVCLSAVSGGGPGLLARAPPISQLLTPTPSPPDALPAARRSTCQG